MRLRRLLLAIVAVTIVAGAGGLAVKTKTEAHKLIVNPAATRQVPTKTPADYDLPYRDVTVTTSDGLKLAGWDVPSSNGVVVIFLHGFRDHRGRMLGAAALFHRHGYGVLLASVRGHDRSDGELVTFGHHEMKDVDAWYRYLASRPSVAGYDPERVAILGASMGGSLAIQYAAGNPRIEAVIADCAFSSLEDTVTTSVKFFTGLPAFPFVPLIRFWAEREAGYSFSEIDAKKWIGRISPRPVFLMQGGADVIVSRTSGELLYRAARDRIPGSIAVYTPAARYFLMAPTARSISDIVL